jgi:hypothetical protein
MNSYIYTFIREDISPAQQIVQLGHACHEAGKLLPHLEFKQPSSLILLSAKDEQDLEMIARKIDCAGIDFYMFYEPDNGMGHSAICTRPIMSDRERVFFRKWDLYRPTY